MLHHVQRNLLLELVHKERAFRARTNGAHVANEHVEKLRQLVQARLAQEGAEPGLTRVVDGGPGGGGGVIAVHAHGAELEHVERAVVEPHPLLPEQKRPRRGELDPYGYRQHDRTGDNERRGGDRDVEGALQESPQRVVEWKLAHAEKRDAVEFVDLRGAGGEEVAVIGYDADAHPGLFADIDQDTVPGVVAELQGDHHLVYRFVL